MFLTTGSKFSTSAILINNVLRRNGKAQRFCFYSTKRESEGQISFGDVTGDLKVPKNPELVPKNYGEF